MRIILQEKVANLGRVGDIVKVKPGYARNFLLPRGKGLRATDQNLADFELKRADLEKRAQDIVDQAKARLDKLVALHITLEAQASEEGRLFGSVGPREIADMATSMGVELLKSEVHLPEGPIRAVGDFEADIVLQSEVQGKMKIIVKAMV